MLAVVAGVQPRVMIDGLTEIIIAADFRLGEENGIGDDGRRPSDDRRGSDEVIRSSWPDRSAGVPLRRSHPCFMCVVSMYERVARPIYRWRSLGRCAAPGRRMRAAVHPDDAVTFGGLAPKRGSRSTVGEMRIALFPRSAKFPIARI